MDSEGNKYQDMCVRCVKDCKKMFNGKEVLTDCSGYKADTPAEADIDLSKQICIHITEMGWHETNDYDYRIIQSIIDGYLEKYESEVRARVVEEIRAELKLLEKSKCNDTSHDDRWCPTCETKLDTIDMVEQILSKVDKGE